MNELCILLGMHHHMNPIKLALTRGKYLYLRNYANHTQICFAAPVLIRTDTHIKVTHCASVATVQMHGWPSYVLS